MAVVSVAMDLLGVDGPGEGLRAELDPDEPLLIGRGLKGLEVPDPLVSLQHATIQFQEGRFTIIDLDTAAGTNVEGARIPPREPVPITVGTRIVLGSSTFEIVERHRLLRRMAELGVLGAMGLVILCAGLYAVAPRRETSMALVWSEPIAQGARTDPQLALDMRVLRSWGVHPSTLRIRRVTDFDRDGISEVWLTGTEREFVVTFAPDGRWTDLGSVARGCTDVRGGATSGLPMLECGALTYAVLDGPTYQVLSQKGVVVWSIPGDTKVLVGAPTAHLVKVGRAGLRRETGLAGLLAANGVDRPVHYIICGSAFPDLPALALTDGGGLHALATGCSPMLQVSGLDAGGGVAAVAFTAAGHEALLEDLETYLGDTPDGLFRDEAGDAVSAAWRAEPAPLAAAWVAFDGADHFFDPVAKEAPVRGARRWRADAVEGATSVTLVGAGKVRLDPPGCSILEVETGLWNCQVTQRCLPSSTFATVRDVGCGEPSELFVVPYEAHAVDGTVDDLQVRFRVDSANLDPRLDVFRARIGWRPVPTRR